MNLHRWSEKLKEVDSKTGHHIAKVKLCHEHGTVWETWEFPFPDPNEFVSQVQTILSELAEEWPARRNQVMLVGEDPQGTVVSQCPVSVMGKNKQASGALFNSEARALAEAMDSIARTTERVLGTANAQMAIMQRNFEQLSEQNSSLLQYIQASNEAKALQAGQEVATTVELQKQIASAVPVLVEMLPTILSRFGAAPSTARTAGKVARLASVAGAAVAQASNPSDNQE